MSTSTSIFSYNISRPYPFRWFTPIAIIGVIGGAILFSFITFASSGYMLVLQYSLDPNVTVALASPQLAGWIGGIIPGKASSFCEPTSIPIHTKLLTNNSAVIYTLTSVHADSDGSARRYSPSLIYMNNPFRNCSIGRIDIQLNKWAGRTAAQYDMIMWGVVASAAVSCRLDTDGPGPTIIGLTAEYDPFPPSGAFKDGVYTFSGRNMSTQASLYWGESLLSVQSGLLMRATESAADDFQTGTITFRHNDTSKTAIEKLDFFDAQYQFVVLQDGNHIQPIFAEGPLESLFHGDFGAEVDSNFPNLKYIKQADLVAKSLWSVILTDLGQVGREPNVLTSPDLLREFTANFPDIRQFEDAMRLHPGPATQDYDTLKNITGPLGVKPSVIQANYICQVPRQKPIPELVVTILTNDLVFLKAFWAVLVLLVGMYLGKKYPESNDCRGCSTQHPLLRDGYKEAASDESGVFLRPDSRER